MKSANFWGIHIRQLKLYIGVCPCALRAQGYGMWIVYNCICVSLFLYFWIKHLGTQFLTSWKHQLFRNKAYVWSFWHFVTNCICVFVLCVFILIWNCNPVIMNWILGNNIFDILETPAKNKAYFPSIYIPTLLSQRELSHWRMYHHGAIIVWMGWMPGWVGWGGGG